MAGSKKIYKHKRNIDTKNIFCSKKDVHVLRARNKTHGSPDVPYNSIGDKKSKTLRDKRIHVNNESYSLNSKKQGMFQS